MNTATTSRRAVLRGLAAAPVLATPVLAAGFAETPDPVFNLIATHRRLHVRKHEAYAEEDRWSKWAEAYKGSPRYRAESLALGVVTDAAYNAETDALEVLFTTVPATLAGTVALLAHIRHLNDHYHEDRFESLVDPYAFLGCIHDAIAKHVAS